MTVVLLSPVLKIKALFCSTGSAARLHKKMLYKEIFSSNFMTKLWILIKFSSNAFINFLFKLHL